MWRHVIAAFAITIAALLIPYEILVRMSERRYGVRRAKVAMPRTLSPKVDSFLADFESGVRYAAYATGTSRTEAAVRPDVLDPVLGSTFNLGFGGTSSIATLEFLERLHLYPKHLIVGVSPMDFTALGVQRGEKGIARAQWGAGVPHSAEIGGSPLADYTREAFYSVLHSARPARRRNLGQWLELSRDGGEVLAFLNNEDATGPPIRTYARGYVLLKVIAPPDVITAGQWSTLPGEYASGHRVLLARMAALIRRFRERGTDVTLVRLPTALGVRRSEDAQTSFDADVRTLDAHYIDGFALMGEAFATDHRNFADAEHLNGRGALQFSAALARAMGSSSGRAASSGSGP